MGDTFFDDEDDDIDEQELIAEIEREAREAQEALLKANETLNANATLNDTLNDLGATANAVPDFNGGAQLTTFQDSVISTGSDVSLLLMVILVILFIVQMIRKTYKHFSLQKL